MQNENKNQLNHLSYSISDYDRSQASRHLSSKRKIVQLKKFEDRKLYELITVNKKSSGVNPLRKVINDIEEVIEMTKKLSVSNKKEKPNLFNHQYKAIFNEYYDQEEIQEKQREQANMLFRIREKIVRHREKSSEQIDTQHSYENRSCQLRRGHTRAISENIQTQQSRIDNSIFSSTIKRATSTRAGNFPLIRPELYHKQAKAFISERSKDKSLNTFIKFKRCRDNFNSLR